MMAFEMVIVLEVWKPSFKCLMFPITCQGQNVFQETHLLRTRGRAEIQKHSDEREVSCAAQARRQEARSPFRHLSSSEAAPRLRLVSPRLGVAMQPPAATRFTLGLPVLLLVPWVTAAAAGSVVGAASSGRETHALSLSYNFNITSRARPGQPWCEIQGLVNGNQFLSYNCRSKEVKPVGPLGMKLKDTAFWERQKETLEDLVEELRKKLLDIKTGIFTKSHPLTLQGRLMYECGPDRHPRGSWQFAFNEQITHRFDPEIGNWTVVPSGDQQFQGTLDSDGELTGFLMRISNGDCKGWLRQVLEHWDEMLETTGAPATTSGLVRVKGTAIRLITSILPVLLTCSILPGI